MTNYRWVNHGNTWDFGGDFTFLWAAPKDAGSATQPHWDIFDAAGEGEAILHHARLYLIAVSRVEVASTPAVRSH